MKHPAESHAREYDAEELDPIEPQRDLRLRRLRPKFHWNRKVESGVRNFGWGNRKWLRAADHCDGLVIESRDATAFYDAARKQATLPINTESSVKNAIFKPACILRAERASSEIPQHEFARKSMPEPPFPENPIAPIPAFSIVDQSLRNISRTTN
jgi:hypothetical protein